MPKCSFCGDKTPDARGKMYVRNDGKIFYFCNSKCHKNWKLHREGKSTKWTNAFQKAVISGKAAKPASGQESKEKPFQLVEKKD